jgi:acyl-coenzyme A synthetase/AMP-(fatty) acid ligase
MNNFILNNTDSNIDFEILAFIKKIEGKEDIVFTTSGTTGKPKKIIHNYKTLVKNIKIKEELKDSVWGLTYDYTKMAGSQVILQSYLNKSKIVNLFEKSYNETIHLIKKYNVTHISATPTFYRLLTNNIFEKIKQTTIGGEPVDINLINSLKKMFPNAKITNIYASTEFGTLFSSNDYCFEISEKIKQFVKIINETIFIKKNNEWIDTGDKIEWLESNKFKIIGRELSMINVGGVKVNPIKIESAINGLYYVLNSYVYGKNNSIMGTVVIADIVLKNNVDKNTIKKDLEKTLNKYEIPLKINIVDYIDLNSTGKIIRK